MVDLKSNRTRHAPALEWLNDLSGQSIRITVLGSCMLLAENHCGISVFTDERIVIAANQGCVEICGGSLTLYQVRADALMIRGSIASISFPLQEGGQI